MQFNYCRKKYLGIEQNLSIRSKFYNFKNSTISRQSTNWSRILKIISGPLWFHAIQEWAYSHYCRSYSKFWVSVYQFWRQCVWEIRVARFQAISLYSTALNSIFQMRIPGVTRLETSIFYKFRCKHGILNVSLCGF